MISPKYNHIWYEASLNPSTYPFSFLTIYQCSAAALKPRVSLSEIAILWFKKSAGSLNLFLNRQSIFLVFVFCTQKGFDLRLLSVCRALPFIQFQLFCYSTRHTVCKVFGAISWHFIFIYFTLKIEDKLSITSPIVQSSVSAVFQGLINIVRMY